MGAVNKDVDALEDSKIIQMLQALAVPVIGNVCHLFMHGLNHVQVYLDSSSIKYSGHPERFVNDLTRLT